MLGIFLNIIYLNYLSFFLTFFIHNNSNIVLFTWKQYHVSVQCTLMYCRNIGWGCTLFSRVAPGLGYPTFAHRTFSLFENVQMCDCTFWCSLKMCECGIALFGALWKCANVRSHFLSLFKNMQMWDRTICRFFKKCNCAIIFFVALWKYATCEM